MTTILSINHKRSSSNMDAQQYEPPIKKSSFSSLPASEIQEAPRVQSGNKKIFTRVAMGDFLTKCGLIGRGQQVFEDFFVNEDKNEFLPEIFSSHANERMAFSAGSLDYSSGFNHQIKAKCISAYSLHESEQINSCINKQQQQQLLETRAREESSEFSMICDEDQIDDSHKCNFLTEQLEPSHQIIIQGCESAQPLVRDCQDQLIGADKIKELINNDEEYNNNNDQQDGFFELKVIEFGICN